ncbi:MAG: hypothetical protein JWQ38_1381 [Flavipsychrobacter sp.]|nr:hypothetical protein [Flavipsychrobacter sp.]
MPAKTIDEVITRLEAIIEDCSKTGSSAGYFAALYHSVTCRVKKGILSNEFEDNARMERLDVIFANRYITAYDQWKNKQAPTTSWATAFNATPKRSTIVLQHLLVGMNAHINLDLGIAAVEVMAGGSIHDIQKDFNAINTVLAAMVYEVIRNLNRVSPLLSLLGLHATDNNEMLIGFTIDSARDGAWCFAEDLAKQPVAQYATCIATRDTVINGLAKNIVQPSSRLVGITLWFVHVFEWRSSSKIINVMYKKQGVAI